VRRTSSLAAAERRTRVRRVGAFGGMLVVVGGLVAVRSVVAPTPTQALSSPGLAAAVPSNQASPSASGPTASTSPSASAATRHHHAHHHQRPTTPTPRPTRPAVQHLTGQAYNVGYGIVQVEVTMSGSRITDVTAVSLPQGGRSGDISSYAAPQLRREAIAHQSARIDSVSGASYTSAGYAQSLQSALDKSAS
jgi:uncharacterized protein with FMN-binding domain